jgi:hypothetical protein
MEREPHLHRARRGQQAETTADIERLRAESARLEAALADAVNTQRRYDEAARKLAALKARVQGLLADANYRWPNDLPYVRIPKSAVKSLDLLNRSSTWYGSKGALTGPALELFGITAQEKGPTEQALASYWRGVEDLTTANAYETNSTSAETGRVTETVIVPPLGQPLKTLAADTASSLTGILGADREQLLFAGWDQGAIQIFWPGNLWKISEESQTFTAWVDLAAGDAAPSYGADWSEAQGGTSSQGAHSLDIFPHGIVTRFFDPWLGQYGITSSTP